MSLKTSKVPRVSIGMPVYNGEKSIGEALDSLLSQTFKDFELIISDNSSIDDTETICREYAEKDPRIRYVRQRENRGAAANFQFVLDEAVGDYFMWAAADDSWGKDFIQENYDLLELKKEYIGSMSKTLENGKELREKEWLFICSLPKKRQRIQKIAFRHGSNSIYYSLFRRAVLEKFRLADYDFLAGDWALILDIVNCGKIHVFNNNYQFFKRDGIGSRVEKFDVFRRQKIEYFLPFYQYSKKILKKEKSLILLFKTIKFNFINAGWYWGAKLKSMCGGVKDNKKFLVNK